MTSARSTIFGVKWSCQLVEIWRGNLTDCLTKACAQHYQAVSSFKLAISMRRILSLSTR